MGLLPVVAKAFLIQLTALTVTLAGFFLLRYFSQTDIFLTPLLLVQGTLASGLSYRFRLPPWWWLIQFFFLPAVVAAGAFHFPPLLYLAAFLLLLLFYWSTFKTQVPLYLSGRRAWRCVAEQLPVSAPFRFIDMGSGLGGLPLYLKSARPTGEYHGVEVAPAPWLISRLRAVLSGKKVQFMRLDYSQLDLADYDVVFVFLSPAVMSAVWKKARAEMRSGAVLLSLSFPVEEMAPDFIVQVAPGKRHMLYGWTM